jgi:hypothetical protein
MFGKGEFKSKDICSTENELSFVIWDNFVSIRMFAKGEFKIKDICSTFVIRNNYKRHVLWHIIIRSKLMFLLEYLVKVNLKLKILIRQS